MSESDSEKSTPPVPPSDEIVHPVKNTGTRILERERVDVCDCGGTLYQETIATGRVIIATWSAEHFDPDEYALTDEYLQTEGRVECDRCGAGWSF